MKDPVPSCSICGAQFTRRALIDGRTVWWFCPQCDAHGSGCLNHDHPPGKCVYE